MWRNGGTCQSCLMLGVSWGKCKRGNLKMGEVLLFCENCWCINSRAQYALCWFVKTSKTTNMKLECLYFPSSRLHFALTSWTGSHFSRQLLLFPLQPHWFCLQRTISAVLCHVFQSNVWRCLAFFMHVGVYMLSNGSLCLFTWECAGASTNKSLCSSYVPLFCPCLCREAIKFTKMRQNPLKYWLFK